MALAREATHYCGEYFFLIRNIINTSFFVYHSSLCKMSTALDRSQIGYLKPGTATVYCSHINSILKYHKTWAILLLIYI